MSIEDFVFLNVLLSEISDFKKCKLESHFFKIPTTQLIHFFIHKCMVYIVRSN